MTAALGWPSQRNTLSGATRARSFNSFQARLEYHMSISKILGVDDVDNLLMTAARDAWPAWVREDPHLGVVDDLLDLPKWLRAATPSDRDGPMRSLAVLAGNDDNAAVALAWLLVPGAKRIGAKLQDVAPDIDGLVAGQLWIEIRSHGGTPPRAVAMTILRNVERSIQAEFGMGEAGLRADRTNAKTQPSDTLGEQAIPVVPRREPEAQHLLRVIAERMLAFDHITIEEVRILASAADHAEWLEKPLRGRAGVTSPDALEVLTWLDRTKARSMRRHVAELLDRVAEFTRGLDLESFLESEGDDLTFAEWARELGDSPEASAYRRCREWMLKATRAHALTWDPVAERCALEPWMCPDCIRAENAA